jgi:catalase
LYEAIEKGEYPKWSVEIQTMTSKETEELWEKQKINVFDLTHVWAQKQFPLRKVGEFVLNENAINYSRKSSRLPSTHLICLLELNLW